MMTAMRMAAPGAAICAMRRQPGSCLRGDHAPRKCRARGLAVRAALPRHGAT
jgi:hypothetical protein